MVIFAVHIYAYISIAVVPIYAFEGPYTLKQSISANVFAHKWTGVWCEIRAGLLHKGTQHVFYPRYPAYK